MARRSGLEGQEYAGPVPGRAGGAGGWSEHHVLRGPAGCLSSTEKAAKLGCFGLKIPGGDRESLKGKIKKKKIVGMGKENESCCPRAST